MNEFIEIPANRKSMSSRKLLHGIGINDALYLVHPVINGKQIMCPHYRVWSNMIKRCYCTKSQQRDKSYKDTTVCIEWHTFSIFKSWMNSQEWQNKHLDKDILSPLNNEYSPNKCIFVSRELNNLLVCGDYGKCKIGVFFNTDTKKYRATIHIDGRSKYIGEYMTENEAFNMYRIEKIKYIETFYDLGDEKIKNALTKHILLLKEM